MGQAAQELVATVVVHDRLGDHHPEARHPLAKPRGHPAMMQRQIGAARTMGHPASRNEVGTTLNGKDGRRIGICSLYGSAERLGHPQCTGDGRGDEPS